MLTPILRQNLKTCIMNILVNANDFVKIEKLMNLFDEYYGYQTQPENDDPKNNWEG